MVYAGRSHATHLPRSLTSLMKPLVTQRYTTQYSLGAKNVDSSSYPTDTALIPATLSVGLLKGEIFRVYAATLLALRPLIFQLCRTLGFESVLRHNFLYTRYNSPYFCATAGLTHVAFLCKTQKIINVKSFDVFVRHSVWLEA